MGFNPAANEHSPQAPSHAPNGLCPQSDQGVRGLKDKQPPERAGSSPVEPPPTPSQLVKKARVVVLRSAVLGTPQASCRTGSQHIFGNPSSAQKVSLAATWTALGSVTTPVGIPKSGLFRSVLNGVPVPHVFDPVKKCQFQTLNAWALN